MGSSIIPSEAIDRRLYWIEEIRKLSGTFSDDSDRLAYELRQEISRDGVEALISHLRLCGCIPESYEHDSSEEKLYSKYTDNLLALAYEYMGMRSIVIKERADVADVEGYSNNFTFVGDAKAFRLSRTAKNQKDFKVQEMDRWKHGKQFAMVVCPIYQLPSKTSQIYQQASSRNVCIFTYSHLSLLVNYASKGHQENSQIILNNVFNAIPPLNASKSAYVYWQAINKSLLSFSDEIIDLWRIEKMASVESVKIAKEEGLRFLSEERDRIMRMTHDEALKELISINRIESRMTTIKSVSDNGLFGVI